MTRRDADALVDAFEKATYAAMRGQADSFMDAPRARAALLAALCGTPPAAVPRETTP
jgi:hypothetical protein